MLFFLIIRMGLEKLISRGRKGIATLGILGMLGSFGCSTLTEGEITTIAGEVLTEKGKSELERLAGRILLSAGTMKYQKELAEAGRTQIVYQNVNYGEGGYSPKEGYTWVNPENPEDFRVKELFGSGFSFRWVDYNKSGDADNLDEYVELKNRFRQNESIILTLVYGSEEPFHQNLKIYDPKGKIILEYNIDPFQKKACEKQYLYYTQSPEKLARVSEDFYEWTMEEWEKPSHQGITIELNAEWVERLLNIWGEGEYSAVWRVNGKIKDLITFDIIY